MNRLDPELLAEIHIMFPADLTRPPQLYCTKPDRVDEQFIMTLLRGGLGSLGEFARIHHIAMAVPCSHCGEAVPLIQPEARPPQGG